MATSLRHVVGLHDPPRNTSGALISIVENGCLYVLSISSDFVCDWPSGFESEFVSELVPDDDDDDAVVVVVVDDDDAFCDADDGRELEDFWS